MSPDTNTVIAAIELAFADLSPGAITLHEAEALDDYATEPERKKARSRDPEIDWRQVPEASLIECTNALPHLDPIGWRFSTLDADQARAVLAFLKLASEDDDYCDALVARQAIEKYWRHVADS